jgi:hypothetical protein
VSRHDLGYGRNLSPGEIGVLEVLRIVALPVVSRTTSLTAESVSEPAVRKLRRRGYVHIIKEDDVKYVALTDEGIEFLKDAFPDG